MVFTEAATAKHGDDIDGDKLLENDIVDWLVGLRLVLLTGLKTSVGKSFVQKIEVSII